MRTSVLRTALVACSFALAFILVGMLFIGTPAGQQFDAWALGRLAWAPDGAAAVAVEVIRQVVPIGIVAAAVALAVWRLVADRRAGSVAAAAAGALVASVLAQVIKTALVRPDLGGHGYAENTFPSGHVTVALAAGIACVWLLPHPSWRPVATAVVGAAALTTMVVSVGGFAHRPSDVLAAPLLVAAVMSCAGGAPAPATPLWVWLPVGGGFVSGIAMMGFAWWGSAVPGADHILIGGFGVACLSAVAASLLATGPGHRAAQPPGYTEPTAKGMGLSDVGDSA